MFYKDRIYFSVTTKTDLRENKDLAEEVLNLVISFCNAEISKKLMITYDDEKGHKKPALTEKSLNKFLAKFREDKIGLLTITDYLSSETYYEDYGFDLDNIEFECNLTFKKQLNAEYKSECNVVCMSIKYIDESKTKNFINLFFQIHLMLNGIGSFINRGTDEQHSTGIFDWQYCRGLTSFSMFWDEQVRGYFWLMFLTDKQVNALGGIEKIDNQGFYSVEKADSGVFIQCTENILDYAIDDALKLRDFLKPIFPPLKKKTGKFFPNREYMEEKMKKGLYLFDEKDML